MSSVFPVHDSEHSMAAVMSCPDRESLQRLLLGMIAEPEGERLAQHLEECPQCTGMVEALRAEDTLTEAARGQATVTDEPEKAAVSGLISRLQKSGPPAAAPTQETIGASMPPMPTQGSLSGQSPESDAEDAAKVLAPPQGPGEIGRLGAYRVIKVLGAGGMGVVFQAEDVLLKRLVALKVMKPDVAVQPGARERFLREAQAAAALDHEHIISIYQVGEERGMPFLAMPFLKGVSLDQWLKRAGSLEPAVVMRLGRQVALGLAAAHDRGLIHRDIKPANLWLEELAGKGGTSAARYRVKILDFGLARPAVADAHLTQSGAILGTPSFMAPEQARGDKMDHRCDLFSLGVVLYRMSAGKMPFRGKTTMAVLSALVSDSPPPVHEVNPAVPAALAELIMQLLSKDPATRPASAKAVADRLLAMVRQPGESRTELAPSEKPPSPAPASVWTQLTVTAEPRAEAQPVKNKSWKPAVLVAAGIGAVALLAAGVIFFLQTPHGTVRVEINDPTIQAVVTGNGAVIKGGEKGQDIVVATGEHALKITRGDLEFETDKFQVKKGDTVALRVELLPGKVQVVRGDKAIGEKALPVVPADERKIAEAMLALGGRVTLYHPHDEVERKFEPGQKIPDGDWEVRAIDACESKQVTNSSLKGLAGLKGLQWLSLSATQITDTGLKELAGLRGLKYFDVAWARVSDAGLKNMGLANHKELAYLILGGTGLTDEGLKEVAGLSNLLSLRIYSTGVTDAGLKQLAGLQKLEGLDMGAPGITDQGLKNLPSFKNLRGLGIDHTQVADSGLKELARFPTLQNLNLLNTQVTDAGLKHLADLRSLGCLDVRGAKVSAAGVAELQKALPKCQIVAGPGPS
jgi:serine/threonine protein kinase